jgi:hypothetical protein
MYLCLIFGDDPGISSGEIALSCFSKKANWWPYLKSDLANLSRNVDGAEIHDHVRVDLSRSNNNKIGQLRNLFRILISVTLKSRSNQNRGIMSCILNRCTYDQNLEMIQAFNSRVIGLSCFSLSNKLGSLVNKLVFLRLMGNKLSLFERTLVF